MYTLRTISQRVPLLALALLLAGPAAAQDAAPPFRIERGDRIVFIGSTVHFEGNVPEMVRVIRRGG